MARKIENRLLFLLREDGPARQPVEERLKIGMGSQHEKLPHFCKRKREMSLTHACGQVDP
jgi:hypothetical protein